MSRLSARKPVSPGSVVVVLAGPYAGRRCVALKELAGGKVAVAGPYTINKAPLVAMPKSQVVVTSTKIDVSSVDVAAIEPKLFTKKEKDALAALRAKVDSQVESIVKKDETLVSYLKSKFSLSNTFGVPPHQLKF